MKILFYGDSITDAGRNREVDFQEDSYGGGYVKEAKNELLAKNPEHVIYNRGISGDRIVDIYARIKKDVWNLEPEFLSILIGVNDVWHEIEFQNGVELERFERLYRMLLQDTLEKLPNLKIVLCEPFILHGTATDEKWERFLEVKEYAKVAKKLANELGLYFLPLQDALDKAAAENGLNYCAADGVHPSPEGAKVIANEWTKFFHEQIEK